MPSPRGEALSRRRFLRLTAAGAAAVAGGGVQLLLSCGESSTGPGPGTSRTPLPTPETLPAAGATLTPGPGIATIASGETSPAWLFNGLLPGPTIRVRRGDAAGVRLTNRLAEPTIVHWHGLIVPPEADGHPRDAIEPDAAYDYAFPIVQRSGTFWYHPHPHGQTAAQIHRGLAGFLLIADDEEDALGLPSGPREILLMIQDRDGDPAHAFEYAPTSADLHNGMLREVPFGNGVRQPTLQVIGARYRFRVLNASHARVFLLGLDTGAQLQVIGNDGGLLPAPVAVDSVYLGVGERVDCLLDFAALPVGARLMLKSLPFTLPGVPHGDPLQGAEMDLLELVRVEGGDGSEPPLPPTLSSVPPLGPAAAERLFVFQSTNAAEMHLINGLSFEMDRIDEQVPFGQVERWIFHNDSTLPHPVHLHGTHFQVESRTGGRAIVYPYEGGWKDTVLVLPLETVSVLVRFDHYRGIYLLHCHNLQHEDLGMMLNIEVL
jgi:FtsP/CotA-like multicopper oxidase with cupredoxin domain